MNIDTENSMIDFNEAYYSKVKKDTIELKKRNRIIIHATTSNWNEKGISYLKITGQNQKIDIRQGIRLDFNGFIE